MTVTETVKYQLSLIQREPGESNEQLARRMFYRQMEVYSAHAGRDLYRGDDFEYLDKEIKAGWIACAAKLKDP